MSRVSFAFVVSSFCVLGAATTACGRGALKNDRESPDALGRAVLEAIAGRDRDALQSLSLDEEEFREQVWPELPASRRERNLPFGYVWTDLRTKSHAGLNSTLAAHGGRIYQLEKVTFTGGTTQYRTFLVHRAATLDVRDRHGQQQTLTLFGSVIEKDRRFKIFSYVVD